MRRLVDRPWGDDAAELIELFNEHGVDFLVVGAHALGIHGVSRATGDLDILLRCTHETAVRAELALMEFGAPLDMYGITHRDFEIPEWVYQLGVPPHRIDLLTSITAVDFEDAWADRVEVEVDGQRVGFIGREQLIQNKLATGRVKDLLDIEQLR